MNPQGVQKRLNVRVAIVPVSATSLPLLHSSVTLRPIARYSACSLFGFFSTPPLFLRESLSAKVLCIVVEHFEVVSTDSSSFTYASPLYRVGISGLRLPPILAWRTWHIIACHHRRHI